MNKLKERVKGFIQGVSESSSEGRPYVDYDDEEQYYEEAANDLMKIINEKLSEVECPHCNLLFPVKL